MFLLFQVILGLSLSLLPFGKCHPVGLLPTPVSNQYIQSGNSEHHRDLIFQASPPERGTSDVEGTPRSRSYAYSNSPSIPPASPAHPNHGFQVGFGGVEGGGIMARGTLLHVAGLNLGQSQIRLGLSGDTGLLVGDGLEAKFLGSGIKVSRSQLEFCFLFVCYTQNTRY